MLTPLQQQALPLLLDYVTKAEQDPEIYSEFAHRQNLKSVILPEFTQLFTEPSPVYVNPAYNQMADAYAGCFVLYDKNPDQYYHMMQHVADPERLPGFLDSYSGLYWLHYVWQCLQDDHNLVLCENKSIWTEGKIPDSLRYEYLGPRQFRNLVLTMLASLD